MLHCNYLFDLYLYISIFVMLEGHCKPTVTPACKEPSSKNHSEHQLVEKTSSPISLLVSADVNTEIFSNRL